MMRHRAWLAEQDIVHCHLTFGAVFGAAVRALTALGKSRPTVVETYHSVGMPMPPLNRWLRARLAARFDAFALMAQDDYWSRFVASHPDLLSRVILNGISDPGPIEADPLVRRAYRRRLSIPDDCRFVVGTVGMLRPDRVPWRFVQIFAQIARALGSQVHFVLAGAGSEYDRVRSMVAEHGLEAQVHMPGLVLDPRLPLSILDLYVTINVREVTGLAALEAAHAGVPVLGIQRADGYCAQPEDWIWSSHDARETAERAIALLRSPAELRALAERQSAYVRTHHSADAMFRSYDALYQAAMERRRRGPSVRRA
jgi:glycosyltransferase involved in cell wall biosynthesis